MEPKYSQKMIDAIEEGEKDIAEGRVHTQAEVLKMLAGKNDTNFVPDFDNLTPEEQEIEDSLESGEYVSVPATEEQKKELQAIARYTLEKTRTINVRLSERDLVRLKATAAREGIPYQTFLTSLIHKNV